MTPLADRIAHLEPEGAYKVLARAQELEREGRDIVHLEIGQPDAPTFEPICQRGKEAIDEGFTRYTPSAGIHELREAIAEKISADKGTTTADQVVVGPGAKPGILFSMLALLNPGDEVIYPDPGFPSYRAAIELAGATPIAAPLIEERNFAYDLDFLDDHIGAKTKLLVINSPSNPTGGNASADDLAAIARLAIERDVWVMTDEIYSDLVYDGAEAPSFFAIKEVRDRTILIDGFSKTYAMTGWRLGYAAMPKSLAEKVSLLTMHAVGCTAGFTQMAGITALKRCQENVAAQRAVYEKRRDRIVEGLRSLPGFSCNTPQGAFYAFPNVGELGIPSRELSHRFLEEAGVACLPGTDFGKNGEGYLRFSYAASISQIEEAIDRIARFIDSL